LAAEVPEKNVFTPAAASTPEVSSAKANSSTESLVTQPAGAVISAERHRRVDPRGQASSDVLSESVKIDRDVAVLRQAGLAVVV
jgi:hypothetical protein